LFLTQKGLLEAEGFILAKHVMIAPLKEELDALFIGIREFPTEKVILLCVEETLPLAEKVVKDIERFKIKTVVKTLKGNVWEEMFRIIGELARSEDKNNLIVNVSTGDKFMSCAASSAAFVHGLKAIGVMGDEVLMLPVLKFSYYKILTEKKMNILKTIYNSKDCCSSLENLSKMTGMSLPLISYHVNGNLKSEGLKDLGLVETRDVNGKTSIKITTLGRLLVKGYV